MTIVVGAFFILQAALLPTLGKREKEAEERLELEQVRVLRKEKALENRDARIDRLQRLAERSERFVDRLERFIESRGWDPPLPLSGPSLPPFPIREEPSPSALPLPSSDPSESPPIESPSPPASPAPSPSGICIDILPPLDDVCLPPP